MVDTYSTKSSKKLFAKTCPLKDSNETLPVFTAILSNFGEHHKENFPTPSSIPLKEGKEKIIELSQRTKNLLAAIQKIDTFAYIHSTNHAAHAFNFGLQLSLSHADMNLVYLASLLHDIGKIFYSDLFTLPRKLSVAEMSIMQEHTYASYIILRQNNYPRFVVLSGLYHHRYFGETNGYPKNEDQALNNIRTMCSELNAEHSCGRISHNDIVMSKHEKFLLSIVMLLDSLDAILDQNRVYKTALKLDQVEEELEPYWGNRYNPELKAPFLKYLDWLTEEQFKGQEINQYTKTLFSSNC